MRSEDWKPLCTDVFSQQVLRFENWKPLHTDVFFQQLLRFENWKPLHTDVFTQQQQPGVKTSFQHIRHMETKSQHVALRCLQQSFVNIGSLDCQQSLTFNNHYRFCSRNSFTGRVNTDGFYKPYWALRLPNLGLTWLWQIIPVCIRTYWLHT